MALEIFKPSPQASPERICIYGRSGIGKTRLGLMLPETEKWGDILYYAADDSSENLKSIPLSTRARVNVVKPRDEKHLHNFQQFCMQNWKERFPKVKTLVVDTFSVVAFKIIQQMANEGYIPREEHFWIGEKGKGGWAVPTRSDYQGIENVVKGLLETIFDKQREFNIIFLCHEDFKEIAKGVERGGPSVPGRKLLEDIPASFDTVIRIIKVPFLPPGATIPSYKPVAISDNDGQYVAKLRESDCDAGNKLGRVELEKNPVNFWMKFDSYMSGEKINV